MCSPDLQHCYGGIKERGLHRCRSGGASHHLGAVCRWWHHGRYQPPDDDEGCEFLKWAILEWWLNYLYIIQCVTIFMYTGCNIFMMTNKTGLVLICCLFVCVARLVDDGWGGLGGHWAGRAAWWCHARCYTDATAVHRITTRNIIYIFNTISHSNIIKTLTGHMTCDRVNLYISNGQWEVWYILEWGYKNNLKSY